VTAVPNQHNGWRYGVDAAWMAAYTAYVVEYRGLTVYFGGDTGYAPGLFTEVRARFPALDVALLPIAPMEPHDVFAHNHMNPTEALDAFRDLGARAFVPIHFDTFIDSTDEQGDAPRVLAREASRRGVAGAVHTLRPGEQAVLIARNGAAPR
jgi:L-ascorbate metabolism protein UlaG (beta-lactamase superfamily)